MKPGEQMGGYRIVRLLGAGTRSRVLLGHDGDRAVAIKVFRPGATPESIDDEIAALSSAAHAHVVQLREVGATPTGIPFLVLERLQPTSLGHLLSARSAVTSGGRGADGLSTGGLSAGEAVTILAPVIAAVGAMHESGVAHGSIGIERVLFRPTGAPVLIGLGRATLFVPPSSQAMLSSSRPVLEDRLALGRLAMAVLSRTVPVARPLAAWLSALERDGYPDGFTEVLLDRVFSLGRAAPVRFPASALPVEPAPAAPPVPSPSGQERRPPATALRGALIDRMVAIRSWVAADGPRAVATSLRSVRRPVLAAAAVGVGSLLAALLLVPPGESSAKDDPAQVPAPSPSASTAPSHVDADDPVLALPVLLSQRSRCLRDLSVICLETVDQSGSAALDEDVALIRAIEQGTTTGSELEAAPDLIELEERHGDVALLSYSAERADSEPASVLLVKGEAGWRIRDYLVG